MDQVAIARISRVFQGDSHASDSERQVANQVLTSAPHVAYVARAIHALRQRMVRYLISCGVRQFVDLASGFPSRGHIHEMFDGVPDARVVYVDAAAEVVEEGQRLVADHPHVAVIHGDIRDRDTVLADPTMRSMLDLRAPIGILCVDTLQFLPDAEAANLVLKWAEVISPQSYVGLTQYGDDDMLSEGFALFGRIWGTPPYVRLRSAEELEDLVTTAGLDLVEPGCVRAPQWHPDAEQVADLNPDRFPAFAALALKPPPAG